VLERVRGRLPAALGQLPGVLALGWAEQAPQTTLVIIFVTYLAG
jgi:hypothetical protein